MYWDLIALAAKLTVQLFLKIPKSVETFSADRVDTGYSITTGMDCEVLIFMQNNCGEYLYCFYFIFCGILYKLACTHSPWESFFTGSCGSGKKCMKTSRPFLVLISLLWG